MDSRYANINLDPFFVQIHLGSIGAIANIKKVALENGEDEESRFGQIRERFSSEYHLRALDVGFDSVIAAIAGSRIDSWTLVRGVADYQHGQSRASRKWQVHPSYNSYLVIYF